MDLESYIHCLKESLSADLSSKFLSEHLTDEHGIYDYFTVLVKGVRNEVLDAFHHYGILHGTPYQEVEPGTNSRILRNNVRKTYVRFSDKPLRYRTVLSPDDAMGYTMSVMFKGPAFHHIPNDLSLVNKYLAEDVVTFLSYARDCSLPIRIEDAVGWSYRIKGNDWHDSPKVIVSGPCV